MERTARSHLDTIEVSVGARTRKPSDDDDFWAWLYGFEMPSVTNEREHGREMLIALGGEVA